MWWLWPLSQNCPSILYSAFTKCPQSLVLRGKVTITCEHWGHLKLYFHLPLFPALLFCKIILPGPSANSPSYQKWKSEKHSEAQKSMPDLIVLHVGSLQNKASDARIEIYVHLYACSTALKAPIWPSLFMYCMYMVYFYTAWWPVNEDEWNAVLTSVVTHLFIVPF